MSNTSNHNTQLSETQLGEPVEIKRYTTRTISTLYFSLIAIALVTIHFSVFEFTTEDLERLYAENQINNVELRAQQVLETLPQPYPALINLQPHLSDLLGYGAQAFVDFAQIPSTFPAPDTMALGEIIELNSTLLDGAYFVTKRQIHVNSTPVQVYLVIDNRLFELSEEQLWSVHGKQVVITLLLLGISLFAIIRISQVLSTPLSMLAASLSQRRADDLTAIPLDDKIPTIELAKLVQTLNDYQQNVRDAMTRERAFNRYASHELRSPLMVMLGSVNILEACVSQLLQDDTNVSKNTLNNNALQSMQTQVTRLKHTTVEMQEFVNTLLDLSKTDHEPLEKLPLTHTLLTRIVSMHTHLITNKSVVWRIEGSTKIQLAIPPFAFQILLGNLVKNAFAYTQEGEVLINISESMLTVSDTGQGITLNQQQMPDRESVEGYGLGLLLVRDICHRYHLTFVLGNNEQGGCCAQIMFCSDTQ